MRFSSSRFARRSATNKRSRLVSRTGTAAPIADRTRTPVALAMASSLRRFSCSAFHCASFVARAGCLLGMVDGAVGIDADLLNCSHVAAFGDDGLGRVLAHLELRARGLVLRLRLVVANRGVLVARQNRAAFLLRPVGGADLDKLRLGCNHLCHVRCHLRLIAGGIGASVALPSEVVAEQQLVVSGALRAVAATARCRNKLSIALVKGRVFQDKQDVVSIQNCRLRRGSRTRVGFCSPL